MPVDLRLLSHWTQSQAAQAHNRDAERWQQPHAVIDAYAALIQRIEHHRKPLRVVRR